MRGYLRGVPAAAAYCGMSENTFRAKVAPHIPKPRIINGQGYYAIRSLDAFMHPENNAADDSLRFRGSLPAKN